MGRTLRSVLRALALVPIAAALLAAPSAAGDFPTPSCSAVTKRQTGLRDVQFRIRCNFSVSSLSIRSSRTIGSVQRRPALRDPDAEDHFRCSRRSATLVRCLGEAGANVRIDGSFGVRGDPCAGLRARFRTQGGLDCEPGTACPDIGFAGRVETRHPRGC
jgi:hypothetical protein